VEPFRIKVVVAATKLGETSREKGKREEGQEQGSRRHQHLRGQTKKRTRKHRKRHVRGMAGNQPSGESWRGGQLYLVMILSSENQSYPRWR